MADVDEHYLIHNPDINSTNTSVSFDKDKDACPNQHRADLNYDSGSDVESGFDAAAPIEDDSNTLDLSKSGASNTPNNGQRRASGLGLFSTITSLISRGRSHIFASSKHTDDALDIAPTQAKPTKMTKEDFTMLRVIGKGSFAKVILVKRKETDQLYAMKVLSKPAVVKRKQVEHTRTERRVLEIVGHLHDHPYISQMHFAFQTESKLYLVLHYCSGGELFHHLQRMKRIPEGWARLYAAELVLALSHLHSHGVAYRDLKPENVLLDKEGHIKICDFGLSKDGISTPTQGASSLCGTPEYLAPEVLDRRGHGTSVDWWGLGMVLFELLTGLPPWYTTDRKQLFARIRVAPLKFPAFAASNMSPESKGFITQLLNRDPAARLGGDGNVEAIKEHPFFTPACGMLATSAGHPAVDWGALMRCEVESPFRPDSMVASEPERYTHEQRAYISKDPQRFRDHTHETVFKCVGGTGGEAGESNKDAEQDPATLARNFDPEHARLPFDSEVGTGSSLFSSSVSIASPDVEFTGFTFDEGSSPHLSLEEEGKTLSSVFKEEQKARSQEARSSDVPKPGKQLAKRLNFNTAPCGTSHPVTGSKQAGELVVAGSEISLSDINISGTAPDKVVNVQPGSPASKLSLNLRV